MEKKSLNTLNNKKTFSLICSLIFPNFSLFKLQNEERIDMLRARQNQLEILGIDLIKY